MQNIHLDLVRRQLAQRIGQAFVGALHVGLNNERQGFDFAFTDVAEHILELAGLLLGQFHVAILALAEQRDLACLALVEHHQRLGAGAGNVRQTLNLDRDRRPRLLDRVSGFIQHRAHATEYRTGEQHIATL